MTSEASLPSQSPTKTRVSLIAWDPDSPAHVDRLVLQRVACGWRHDQVEDWRVLQREGKMTIQWIVLREDDPETDTKLTKHFTMYPEENKEILDTAVNLGGKARVPSSQPFHPVGHISLDSESPHEGQADASLGIYCITTFYISRALQGGGLGRAAMDAVESEAVNEPLCAKVLSLDTLANNSARSEAIWHAIGIVPPKLLNEEWYERRGYKVWKYVEGGIKHLDPQGKMWTLDSVYMKKNIY